MTGEPIDRRLLLGFAELLDYPRGEVAGTAGTCAELLASRSPAAAAQLRAFESFAQATPPTRLEEIYTGLFELDAACHPYVGYHLFGESYKRSVFLLELQQRYRRYAIDPGAELADHLAVVLRFLAANEDTAETGEFISEALHPALRKMLKNRDEDPPDPDIPVQAAPGDEYRRVLHALRAALLTMAPEAPGAPDPIPAGGDERVACGPEGLLSAEG